MLKKTMPTKNIKQFGFTLIELMVVVTIFALIVAGIVPLASKYINEQQTKSTVEQLYSALQLHQSNATHGVNGNWYGVTINNQPNTITLFEVTTPDTCPITLSTPAIDSPECTTVTNEFNHPVLKQSGFDVELTYGTVPSTVSASEKVEARFSRRPSINDIVIARNSFPHEPNLKRLRLVFTSGNVKRIIVIDGGNICSEEVLNNSSTPCNTSSGIIGGPKIGRIFLVENI